ncbi:MAG TPA: DUF1847 domain-containing protein [Methanospirillum sp.]|nr:DUF1847 domain-containing protein [Methanospirillum sp.]
MLQMRSVRKEDMGHGERKKQTLAPEPICNPVAQTTILNEEQTDLNILLGLCVG